MKILALSDEECPALWDYYMPGRLKGYDMIISCGDLKASYLSFIVTMANVPVLYVHGNHDGSYERNPPEGCDCIEDQLFVYKGLRILGLGGCSIYNGGPHQYSEHQMHRRIKRLDRKIRKAGGVDIVLTHAPAAGYGDVGDPAHRGFECFVGLIDRYEPKYWIHSHVHLNYGYNIPRILKRNNTTIINAYERFDLEIECDKA